MFSPNTDCKHLNIMSQTPKKSWEQDKNNNDYKKIWGFLFGFLHLDPLGYFQRMFFQ